MRAAAVGTRVRVIEAGPFDDTKVGSELIVHQVDDDGTFRGRDPRTGKVGGWIGWGQVELACEQIGYAFLKTQLTAETVKLLAAFDGTENLRLKDDVRDRILLSLPELGQRVREEAARVGSEGPRLKPRSARLAARRARVASRLGAALGGAGLGAVELEDRREEDEEDDEDIDVGDELADEEE